MKPALTTPDGTPISQFCFGTMQFGDKADAAEARAMFEAARGGSINFFDTAVGYADGCSETLLGQFAGVEREKLFIATKCASSGDCGAQAIHADIETSLRRLNMDAVDLLYLHRWSDEVPLEVTYEALAQMVDAGRVRHIGVSNYSAWQVMKAERIAQTFGLTIAMIQPMYNLVKRQAEVEILPMAASEGIAVVPYSPLGGGLLTGKYANGGTGGRLVDNPMYKSRYRQDWMHQTARALGGIAAELDVSPITLAVAWVAHNPAVAAPIISSSAAAQLQPSLDAMHFAMDDALYARITALSPTPAPATDRNETA